MKKSCFFAASIDARKIKKRRERGGEGRQGGENSEDYGHEDEDGNC